MNNYFFRGNNSNSLRLSLGLPTLQAILTVFVISLTALAVPYPAQASAPEPEVELIADTVEQAIIEVARVQSPSAVPLPSAGGGSSVAVDVPTDPSHEIVIQGNGTSFGVGLPDEMGLESAEVASDGTTVYLGQTDSVDVSVETLAAGVRVSTVLSNAEAATTFAYRIDPDVIFSVNDDQSISLLKTIQAIHPETGNVVSAELEIGLIHRPWAVDAVGTMVPTRYTVENGRVIQHVDHKNSEFVYPIVADPTIQQINPLQLRIRWNRAETAAIANLGWGAAGAAALCATAGAGLGPGGAAAFGAMCLTLGGSAVYTASTANNSTPPKCLQLTVTTTVVTHPVPWFGAYSCKSG